MIDTIKMAGEICTQWTYPTLFQAIERNLKHYFEVEGVGILVLDENNEFFSIEEERSTTVTGEHMYHFIRFPT